MAKAGSTIIISARSDSYWLQFSVLPYWRALELLAGSGPRAAAAYQRGSELLRNMREQREILACPGLMAVSHLPQGSAQRS